MTTNDFETICQVNEPTTPERSNNERVPPMLTRQRISYILKRDLKELHEKYAIVQNENLNLIRELGNINNLVQHLQDVRSLKIKQINLYEKKINNIQELLFEHSEEIPNGLYLQLMNCLVKK